MKIRDTSGKNKMAGKILGCTLAFGIVLAFPLKSQAAQPSWISSNSSWWYQYEDGSYPEDTWLWIGNNWFYFGDDGWMETGWVYVGDNWYYLLENGAMASDCWVGNYYVGGNGAMLKSQQVGFYYVDADGRWSPQGWKKNNTGWWYQKNDGTFYAAQWKVIGGSWYYFLSNGYMAENRWLGDYYVGNSGAMQTNCWVYGYYVDKDGSYLRNSWLTENGITYWFDEEGSYVKGWVQKEDGWYYFNESGGLVSRGFVDEFYLNYKGLWIVDYLKDGKYPEGFYKVGVDLPEGNYRICGVDGKSPYIETSSDDFRTLWGQGTVKDNAKYRFNEGDYIHIKNGYLIQDA